MTIKHAPFAALGNAVRIAAVEQLQVVLNIERKTYLEMRNILFEQNSKFNKDILLGIHECLFGICNNAFTKLEINTMFRTIKDFKQWVREMEEDSYQVGDYSYPAFLRRAEDALLREVYRWLNDRKE